MAAWRGTKALVPLFEPALQEVAVSAPLKVLEVMRRGRRRLGQSIEEGLSPQEAEKL